MITLLAAGAGGPPDWVGFLPIVGMVVIFWFFIIRPQMRQQKEHREKIAELRKGDRVVTAGGILGTITKLDDDHVTLEIAQGVKVKVVRSTISDTVAPGGKAAND